MLSTALIVVNYRTPEQTCACVETVQRTAGDLVNEVVIVDNASGDGSPERIRGRCPYARVLERADNGGFARGVNAGVDATSADLVLVLNPDTEVQAGAVAALAARLEEEDDLGVTGPLLLHADGSPRQEAYRAWPSLWSLFVSLCLPVGHILIRTSVHPEVLTPRRTRARPKVARVCGSALAIRRRAWNSVGPMDEGYFMYFEEVEWQMRLAEAGWRIALTPEARVAHLVQGGDGLETAPLPYLRSAFRFFEGRGHSRAAIRRIVLTAASLSIVTLRVAGVLPPLREKSRRMIGGYRALIGVARAEYGSERA